MYQFTTTTIINSNLDSNGTTAKYTGSATAFNVTRVNKFTANKIVSVYKRPYAAGVPEVAQVTVPTVTSGTVVRLTVDVRLSQQTDSEYANTYLYFKKPVVVEVLSTGTDTTTATALKNQINGLKDRYGFSYIKATTSGANIILTATNNNQRFWDIKVEKELASYNSLVQPEYSDITAGTFSVTTPGKVGFGDDEYMIKSIMLPTYENSRYFGTNKEERPIIGGNYTQYTLRYSITKDGQDGIVAGGTSITTHVFYVSDALQAAFETELQKAFAGIVTVGTSVGGLTILGDQNVAASSGANAYVVEGATGTVTWSITALTGTSINSSTGVLTVGSTTGTTTISAADAGTGKTATLLVTVA